MVSGYRNLGPLRFDLMNSSRMILALGFLFLLSMSIVPLTNSAFVGQEVTITERGKEFTMSSTVINHTGRTDMVMSYDSESDLTIIFGGRDYEATSVLSDQTWVYDLNTDTYTNMSPTVAPDPKAAAGMVYDSQSDRSILFGGVIVDSTNLATDSTWTYDYNTNTWTDVSPAFAPSPRLAAYLTYDSESDRVILFGGITLNPGGVVHNDTWAYDLETNTWEEMNPTSAPDARFDAMTSYDEENDRVILFGGNPSASSTTSTFSDTWAYDYNTDRWVDLSPPANPTSRYVGKMVYDSESNKTVLFSGFPDASTKDGTWLFDYGDNNWTQANPAPHPTGRFRAQMVYDSESDSIIMFGGMTGAWTSEQVIQTDTTWAYDTNSDTWTKMGEVVTSTTTTTTTDDPTAALVAVVIITGLTLAVVIIVLVGKGVIFPKIEGPKGD